MIRLEAVLSIDEELHAELSGGGGGVQPAETKNITENGLYDVSLYAQANVSVKQWNNELAEILDGSATELSGLPSSVMKIKPYAFYNPAKQLPEEYMQLKSVYFGGDSIIQTDIPYASNPTVKITAKSDGIKNASQVLYGYEKGGNGGTYFGVMPNTTLWSLGSTFNFTSAFSQTDIVVSHNWRSAGNYSITATINGTTHTRSGTATGNPTSVMIGGCISSQGVRNYLFYGDVYGEIKAYVDGTLAYNYVPVKRLSDDKVGYYDIVNGVFKLPIGSALVGGEEIPPIDMESIEQADLSVIEIGDYAFYNNDLSSLTLRANQVVVLGENAIEGTPIANGSGYIYVPSDLLDVYQADSVWGAYSSQIRAIERGV